jgi:hypothetical protein
MSDEIPDRVEREIAGLTDAPTNVGASAALKADADHAARYCELYYAPDEEAQPRRPGLADAGVSPFLAREMRYLMAEIDRTTFESEPETTFAVGRAREVVGELRVMLKWIARGDAVVEAKVRTLGRAHGKVRSAGRVAVALSEYLLVARAHEAALRRLRMFEPSLLDEADALLHAWNTRSTRDLGPASRRRAGLALLLRRKMALVLRAADVVFRHHPDLKRAARSERQLRVAAAIARARRKPAEPETPTVADPETPAEPVTEPTT